MLKLTVFKSTLVSLRKSSPLTTFDIENGSRLQFLFNVFQHFIKGDQTNISYTRHMCDMVSSLFKATNNISKFSIKMPHEIICKVSIRESIRKLLDTPLTS